MKRVLTACFLVPVAVWSSLYAPWLVFTAVVALVSLLCFIEYARITDVFAPAGCLLGLLMLAAPPREFALVLILGTLGALSMPLASADLQAGFRRSSTFILGIL